MSIDDAHIQGLRLGTLFTLLSRKRYFRKAMKYMVLVHRYLGIVFGFVILLWSLSGFVMMFVQYPSLSQKERFSHMSSLDLEQCCVLSDALDLPTEPLDYFTLEQKPFGIQLKLVSREGTDYFDLGGGKRLALSTRGYRRALAEQVASELNADSVSFVRSVNIDQWSIIPSVAKHAPFDIFEINDDQNSRLYFSTKTGELVQQVSLNERTWGWVGSVIHWIYPTVIRLNTELWVQLIIWLSVVCLFMVIVGAFIGVSRLRHKGTWRSSPYRGRFYWHHCTSLVAGILMLMWLFSGLMSMYPWGLMEGRSFAEEKQNLRGPDQLFSKNIKQILNSLSSLDIPGGTVELRGSVVAGHLNLVATSNAGSQLLIYRGSLGTPKYSNFPKVENLASAMRPQVAAVSIDFIERGDGFYYNHHTERTFPVYRIIYEDGERIYLDGITKGIVAVFDDGRKTARWLYLGLHRGDFFPSLNGGFMWYLIWGGLLLVTIIAVGIGCWLAVRCWQRLLKPKRRSSFRQVQTS